jgi:hypothetical protein
LPWWEDVVFVSPGRRATNATRRDAYAPQSIVVCSDGVLTVEAWFGDGDIAAATTWSSLGSHVAKDERRDEDLELSDLKEEIPPELL